MCFVWHSEQTATFALYVVNRMGFITEVESVYCAVGTESLYNTDVSSLKGLNWSKKQEVGRGLRTLSYSNATDYEN